MKIRRTALVLGLALFAGLAYAQEFKIDKVHSQVGFGVKHFMVSTVHGRFTDFDGVIHYDPKDVTKSSVNVTVKTASINTDNQGRDDHLRTDDFLNAPQYPEMTFQSTKVEKRGDGYVLHGNLTLRGVTRPVEIPFTLSGPITDHRGNARIGVEGSTTINRHDFGVKFTRKMQDGSAVVGDQVKITLNIEAVAPAKSDKQ